MNDTRIQCHRPLNWSVTFEMDINHVWDAFFLHTLLLDHQERDESLILRHDAPSQAERLAPALRARNQRFAGPGQEAWNHACDLCCWIQEDESGNSCMC